MKYLLTIVLAVSCGCAALGTALTGPAIQAGKEGIAAAQQIASAAIDSQASKAQGAVEAFADKATGDLIAKASAFDNKIAAWAEKAAEKGQEEDASLWEILLGVAGTGIAGAYAGTAAKKAGLKQGAMLMAAKPENGGTEIAKSL